jgi:hypothetical protein|tara:strand:- start:17592 stop:17744 length:153 start_codon:yes stop_codon:yes gene_type:complete
VVRFDGFVHKSIVKLVQEAINHWLFAFFNVCKEVWLNAAMIVKAYECLMA